MDFCVCYFVLYFVLYCPSYNNAFSDTVPVSCTMHAYASVREVDRRNVVNLNCSSKGIPPVKDYIWTHPNGSVLAGNDVLIFPVSRQDIGWYNCSVYNGIGERGHCSKYIGEKYLPKCDITVCPLRVIKPSGLTIRCNPLYKGPHSSNATIIHPLGKLEGLVFTLSVSGQNNTGWYSCTVNNGIGESGTCWMYIDVLYPPTVVRVVPRNNSVTINEGKSLSLSCHSDSNPAPTFTWKHNGITLTDGHNGTLLFKTVNRKDSGSYICEANNHLGSAQSNVEIVVQYLDVPRVNGLSNKSYCLSNPVVWFNISVNLYADASMYCKSSISDISTVISSHNTGLNVRQYLVFAKIKTDVDNARILCEIRNSAGERQTTLFVYKTPPIFKEKINGQFEVTNQEWQDELQDSKSTVYKFLKHKCTQILERTYNDIPYVVASNVTKLVKGSVIVQFQLDITTQVPDPLLPLKTVIKENGGNINGLVINYNSIRESKECHCPEPIPEDNSNKTLIAVLVALLTVALVLNIILIAYIFWLRRIESNDKQLQTKRPNDDDERGHINEEISLQETSFNSPDNETSSSIPAEYEQIGSRGLARATSGMPQYEAIGTRPRSVVQHSDPIAQNEREGSQSQRLRTIPLGDVEGQTISQGAESDRVKKEQKVTSELTESVPQQSPSNVSPLYQALQTKADDYSSLSSLTRLPPKNTLLSTQTKDVFPKCQDFDDLSRC